MPSIKIRDGEPFDSGLKRFRRICEKEGIVGEVRRRAAYAKPTEVRRKKAIAARKRLIKQRKRTELSMNSIGKVRQTPRFP